MEKYAAIILAAGKGTRMNEGRASEIPKVMYQLEDKPIIWYAVKSVEEAGINKIVLVVGYKKEMVQDFIGDKVEYAEQKEQLGTGHAVMVTQDVLEGRAENIIVFYGDCPLYRPETIKKLITKYEAKKPTIAMLSVISDDPTGYGRLIRHGEDVVGIIEHKDCTPEQLQIKEWNPGFYIFEAQWLWDNIDKLQTNNVQKEYYLTDLIAMAVKQNRKIIAVPVGEENEAIGINTPEQHKEAEEVLKKGR